MDDFKLPIALVVAMVVQISGGVWWVSKQALIISELEETVESLSSRMAIENQVNLTRDVRENAESIDGLWEAVDSNGMHMEKIVELLRRVAILETEMRYLNTSPHEDGR